MNRLNRKNPYPSPPKTAVREQVDSLWVTAMIYVTAAFLLGTMIYYLGI